MLGAYELITLYDHKYQSNGEEHLVVETKYYLKSHLAHTGIILCHMF